MAGEIQVNSVTALTESGSNIVLNNVNTATNRTNLGLGSMATQDANAVALTGGSLTGTEIDLKSSGNTIYKSDGTTAVLSESGGVVTLNNITAGSNISGIGQLVGISYVNAYNTAGNTVTTEANKSYAAIVASFRTPYASIVESWAITTDSSNNATVTELGGVYSEVAIEATTGGVRLEASGDSSFGFGSAFIFEQAASFDAS